MLPSEIKDEIPTPAELQMDHIDPVRLRLAMRILALRMREARPRFGKATLIRIDLNGLDEDLLPLLYGLLSERGWRVRPRPDVGLLELEQEIAAQVNDMLRRYP